MYALNHASWTKIYCRNYTTATVDAAELAALADEKGASFLEGARNGSCKAGFWPDWQSLGSRPRAHLGDHRIAFNGSDGVGVRHTCHIWRMPMQNSANSMTLGAVLAKRLQRSKQLRNGGTRPRSIALLGKSH